MCPTDQPPPLVEALRLMQEALDILDREKAPSDISAHLDLAIQRLNRTLAVRPEDGQEHR